MAEQDLRFKVSAETSAASSEISRFRAALTSEFGQIDKAGRGAISGITNELAILERRIPLVGQPLAGITRELLNMSSAKKGVEDLGFAFAKFQSVLGTISTGGAKGALGELTNLGINAEGALRNPEAAFQTFLTGLRSAETQAGQTALAVNVLGTNVGSKLLPALEGGGEAALAAGGAFTAAAVAAGVLAAGVAAVAVGGGLALAGLFKMAEASAEVGDKYFRLSEQVNITAHNLSALDVAGAQNGVTFEQIGAALGIFDKKLEAGAEGSTKLSRVLKANGVDVRDNQKALEGMFTILSKLPEGETQTALAMEAFGRGGKAMLAIVKQAHGDLPEMIRLLDEMGATITDKDAQAAHEFNEKLELLHKQFDVTKMKVGEELLPVFEKLFDDLSDWLSKNQGELRAWAEGFAAAARGIIASIAEIRAAMNVATSFAGGSASADVHTGGQSYASKAWDWVFNSPDTSQWQAGTGQGTAHMMTPDEIATQARANASYDAYLRRVERDKQAAAARTSQLMGAKGGGRGGGGGANKDARYDEKDIQNAERDEVDRDRQFTEQLKRAYDRRIVDLDDYVKQTKDELDAHFNALSDDYDKEEALIKRTVTNRKEQDEKIGEVERKRKEALQKYEQDKTKIEDEAADKAHAAAVARSVALAGVADASDKRSIAAIQGRVDAQTELESQGEREIGAIQLRMHDRAVQLLKDQLLFLEKGSAEYNRVQGEIGKAEVERAEMQEDTSRRTTAALKAESEARRQLIEDEKNLNLEARRAELAAAVAGNRFPSRTDRASVIQAQAQIERDAEDRQYAQTLANLERQRKAAAKRLEDTKIYDRLIEDEKRRHVAAVKKIDADEQTAEDELDPLHSLKDRWNSYKEGIESSGDSIKDSVAGLSDSVSQSFGNLKDAFGQAIEANILYGASIGKAMEQALAAELAHVAAEAWIESLRHAAWAIGSLAFGNFGAAAKHAAAAAAFAGIALLLGKAGSSLAKSSGMRDGSSASGSAVASTATPTPNNQNFSYSNTATPSGVGNSGVGGMLQKIHAQLSRLDSMPPGNVVTIGAHDARQAIGAAVVTHSGESYGFNDAMARNLRVA